MSDIPIIEAVDAWERMRAEPGTILVDVRSDMEYLMIGHPRGAVHVAWIDAPDWTVNPRFVADVRRLLLGRLARRPRHESPTLLLICRSGNRSMDAARALVEDGVPGVQVIANGFEGPLDEHHHRNTIAGWRHAGLPWEQC